MHCIKGKLFLMLGDCMCMKIIQEIWWSSLMVKYLKIFYFFYSYDKMIKLDPDK